MTIRSAQSASSGSMAAAVAGSLRSLGHYVEPKFLRRRPADRVSVASAATGYAAALHARTLACTSCRAAGGEPKLVTEEGSIPRFNKATATGFSFSARNETAPDASELLISVNLTGGDRRVHLIAENATEFVPSPDETIRRVGRALQCVRRATSAYGRRGWTSVRQSADFPVSRISRDAGHVPPLVARFAARVLGARSRAVSARHLGDVRVRDAGHHDDKTGAREQAGFQSGSKRGVRNRPGSSR